MTITVIRVYGVDHPKVNASKTRIEYYQFNPTEAKDQINSFFFPVDLLSFQAKLVSNTVNISFVVANVMNFAKYNIEWGTDGTNFIKIASISEPGTNNITSTYFYKHFTPSKGKNYYRLKLISTAGDSDVSLIRALNVSKETVIDIFPNPAQQYIKVDFSGSLNLNTSIDLIDFYGKVIKHIDRITTATINISLAGVSPGQYFIRLLQGGYTKNNYSVVITK